LAFLSMLVVAGFAFMFIWANQVTYQVLFNDLSTEDAGAVVSKLRETNIPHKIEGNGTIVMVPVVMWVSKYLTKQILEPRNSSKN
jgi:flagellar M-ring protein FliF